MRKGITKRQRQHARTRFRQRFGIDFTKDMRKNFWVQIYRKEAIFLGKDKKASKWAVFWEGRMYVVVYDRSTSVIVTVYPCSDPLYNKARKIIADRTKEESKKPIKQNIDLNKAKEDIKYYEIHQEWHGGDCPEWAVKIAKYHYYDIEKEMPIVKLMVSNWIENESPEKEVEKV